MDVRNAAFIDLSNLNTVYKVGSKFVLALNYSNAVERLAESLPALGTGYDIYLCLKPRAMGEGDLVIDELSMSGLPFTADSEELYKVLKFFKDSQGVSDIYLCNWVHNYISVARVQSFNSVCYYGNRVCHMEVKNRLLESFTLYDSQRDFAEKYGEEYNGYGDLGLVDTNGLKAQYPELSDFSNAHLTAVAPLIQCYKSPLKLNVQLLYEELSKKYNDDYTSPSEEPAESSEAQVEKLEEVQSVVEAEPQMKDVSVPVSAAVSAPTVAEEEEPAPKSEKEEESKEEPEVVYVEKKVPLVVKFVAVLAVIVSFLFGSTLGIAFNGATMSVNESYFSDLEKKILTSQELANVYGDSYSVIEKITKQYDYVRASGMPVQIVNFQYSAKNTTMECLYTSQDVLENYLAYLEDKYIVLSTGDMGTTEVDGIVYNVVNIIFK